MLTSIARASVRRLVAGHARLPATTAALPNSLAIFRAVAATAAPSLLSASRSFTVSHAAADAAADNSAPKAPRKRSPATNKAAPKKKKKAAAGSEANKTKAKAKPKKKAAKKPAGRPASKKRAKSPKTLEQEEIRALRAQALLKEPPTLPTTAWTVYVARQLKGETMPAGSLADRARQLSAAFRSLLQSDVASLQAAADENKLTHAAAYKAWVESHTPEDIHAANLARRRLVSKHGKKGGVVARQIKDDRQPKRPQTSFALFTKSRWGSGELAGTTVTQAGKDIAAEWKALGAEKERFEDLARQDLERYKREVKQVLHRDVATTKSS